MSLSVYDFRDYRPFLRELLRPRGNRSALARTLQCHSAYLSRVLASAADLSEEQAYRVGTHFGMAPVEGEYFTLLVRHARAGTPDLRAHLLKQIEAAQREHLKIDRRLDHTPKIAEADQLTYYSRWYYSAVHIATSVPKLRRAEAISDYLQLPPQLVRTVLGFLVSRGLVVEERGTYRVGKTHVHADSSLEGSRQHHLNWRQRSINTFDAPLDRDVHYSSVVSCSRKDVPKLQQALVDAVESIRAHVRQSGDEVVCCYLLDLFEAGRGMKS